MRLLLGVIVLAALALLVLAPAASAQRLSVAVDGRADPPARPIPPGEWVVFAVHVSVHASFGSYCLDTLQLEIAPRHHPAYSSFQIEPRLFEFRLSDTGAPVASTTGQRYVFNATATIRTGAEAPAFRSDVYEFYAQLGPRSPASPTCTVPATSAMTTFTLTNDYRPDTRLEPLGWGTPDHGAYGVRATNHGNGLTRIRLEPILVDPFAVGKLYAEDLVIESGKSGILSIRAPERAPGNHTAIIGLRSGFEGELDAPTELDRLVLHLGESPAKAVDAQGNAQGLGAIGAWVSALAVVVLGRRFQGK